MSYTNRGFITVTVLLTAAAPLLAPVGLRAQAPSTPAKAAQSTSSAPAEKGERWLHVRANCTDGKGGTVRVNVPLEMAEKVLPAVNHDRLHNGKVRFNEHEVEGVDIKTILDAVRTSKDGEFVTVQSNDADVRVAKQNGYMYVHVAD